MHASNQSANRDDGSQLSGATSRSLLDRVRAGDTAAWERLVGLYAPLVHQWCRRGELQEADVSDIFQEVFRAVVASIGGFRKEKERDTFRGWLRRITQNKVRDHFRRLGREPGGVGGTDAQQRLAQVPAPPPADALAAGPVAEQAVLFRALDLIRDQFEDRTWQAFWRTAVDGQAPSHVALDLAMTAGAVRVAKCRVLQRLREELGDLLD